MNNIEAILHRELVDLDTLLQRVTLVNVIAEALHYDPKWRATGDLERRRVAKRISFTRHRLDDLYSHEGVSLRNRGWGQ